MPRRRHEEPLLAEADDQMRAILRSRYEINMAIFQFRYGSLYPSRGY
jgi:hypothetical protein